jgi:hypothetical protein
MTHQVPYYRVKAFDVSFRRRHDITSLPPAQRSGPLPEVPLATLAFTEIERRLDYLVFRANFAPSLWDARILIHQGKIKVEGTIVRLRCATYRYLPSHARAQCRTPQLQLEPGMMFSTEPRYLKWGLHLPPRRDLESTGAIGSALAGMPELLEPSIPTPSPTASESSDPVESSTSTDTALEGDALPAGDDAATPIESPEAKAERRQARAAAGKARRAALLDAETETRRRGELEFRLPEYAAPSIFVPAYLEVNYRACAAVYVRHPTAKVGLSEIPSPWDATKADLFRLNQVRDRSCSPWWG